jgi:hypothetical protein
LTACFAICQGRRCAALGRGETREEVGMGRVVQFRQKPTKFAGQGRSRGGAASPPTDVLTIVLAVAVGGLALLKLWHVMANVWVRRPRLEVVPHTSLRWRR